MATKAKTGDALANADSVNANSETALGTTETTEKATTAKKTSTAKKTVKKIIAEANEANSGTDTVTEPKADATKSTKSGKSTTKTSTAKTSTKKSTSSDAEAKASDTKTDENKEAAKATVAKTAKTTQPKTTTKKSTTSGKSKTAETNKQETVVSLQNADASVKESETKEPTPVPSIKVSDIELMEDKSQKKTRNKYAVMLVKEHEDGAISTHHIGTALCEFILGALFIIILVCICVIIYDSVSLKKLRSEVVNQIVQINDLTEQNEILSVENDSLSSKVSVLSETVTKKAATEEAMTQEESENAIPKGFPLSGGTSTMTSGTDDNSPILQFDASAGINIVSSGTGTVLAIEDDADYGHRIIIDHGNGYRSIYRNSGEPLVKEGETLGKGYILFSIGNGNEKIGYQIMIDNQYVDPMEVIEING